MLLHYADGRVLVGILLNLKGNQMRVAVKDAEDIAEFMLLNGVWVSECCETVTFEFPTAAFEAIGMLPETPSLKPNPQPDFFPVRQPLAKVASLVN